MKPYALWFWELAKRAGVALALVLDCSCSVLVGESFGSTLSAKAWDSRAHRYWGWCRGFIDSLPVIGGEGHCQRAWERERKYGTVWAAWMDKTRRVLAARPGRADTQNT